MIQELSDADFIFDISKASDAYRLFAMLRLQGSPDLLESVDALMGARSIEIFDTVLRDEYQSWKQPQRIPGGYYDRTKPAESHRRIDSWRTNVAKSSIWPPCKCDRVIVSVLSYKKHYRDIDFTMRSLEYRLRTYTRVLYLPPHHIFIVGVITDN